MKCVLTPEGMQTWYRLGTAVLAGTASPKKPKDRYWYSYAPTASPRDCQRMQAEAPTPVQVPALRNSGVARGHRLSTASRRESGKRHPSGANLSRYAAFLGALADARTASPEAP